MKFENLFQILPRTGRIQGENGVVVNVVDTGVDVNVQDQTSDIVDYLLCREIEQLQLAVDAVIDEYTITVIDGSGVVNGTYVCIQEGKRAFQAMVLSGGGTNTLTFDTPLDFSFTTAGAGISNRSPELNIDGSVTVQIGSLKPGPGVKWDITRIMLSMYSPFNEGAPSDVKFAGIAALTRGIVIRKSNGIHHTLFNAKTNGDIKLRTGPSDVVYSEASPASQYGTGVRRTFGGQEKNGVVIRLDGDKDDELQILIQDDLTNLDFFRAVAQGHVVEDPVSIE